MAGVLVGSQKYFEGVWRFFRFKEGGGGAGFHMWGHAKIGFEGWEIEL